MEGQSEVLTGGMIDRLLRERARTVCVQTQHKLMDRLDGWDDLLVDKRTA